MIRLLPKYILQFVGLILFQVVILNNIQINGYLNPYLYILFIITLPIELAGWAVLILAFTTGISIDLFCNTPGMHTSATLFMAFIRQIILPYLAPREGYENSTLPNVDYYGWSWFAKYAGLLTFTHHLFLFYVETFSFAYGWHTFAKVVISSMITFTLILLTQSKQEKSN